MKRRHLRGDAVALVERLRERRPDLAVGADLIAGFPTESAEHHAANLSIVRELRIVHSHIFPYSPRPGTPAARMPQLDRPTIKQRAAELREAVAMQRSEWLATLVDKPAVVLGERDGTGYTPGFARVALAGGTAAGTLVEITPTTIKDGLLT